MARRKNSSDPSYRLHEASGQAIVSLPRGDGAYKDYLLGPYGSKESKAEYHRILAEWQARCCRDDQEDLMELAVFQP